MVVTVVVQDSLKGVLVQVGSLRNPSRLTQYRGPEEGNRWPDTLKWGISLVWREAQGDVRLLLQSGSGQGSGQG